MAGSLELEEVQHFSDLRALFFVILRVIDLTSNNPKSSSSTWTHCFGKKPNSARVCSFEEVRFSYFGWLAGSQEDHRLWFKSLDFSRSFGEPSLIFPFLPAYSPNFTLEP